jgi:hypothetical protein
LFLSRTTLVPMLLVFPFTLILSRRNFSWITKQTCWIREDNPNSG